MSLEVTWTECSDQSFALSVFQLMVVTERSSSTDSKVSSKTSLARELTSWSHGSTDQSSSISAPDHDQLPFRLVAKVNLIPQAVNKYFLLYAKLSFWTLSDLQTVNISLRTLYRPSAEFLPQIYSNLGLDYEERVLPSIINEVLKSVVVSDQLAKTIIIYPLKKLYGQILFSFVIRLNLMPANWSLNVPWSLSKSRNCSPREPLSSALSLTTFQLYVLFFNCWILWSTIFLTTHFLGPF